MNWATTTFRVNGPSPELTEALLAWRDHIRVAHPDVTEIRCYRAHGGTEITWMEGFEDYEAYARLVRQEDDVCAQVMDAVFRHMVPGTRIGKIVADAI